jgi:hypothetical protein
VENKIITMDLTTKGSALIKILTKFDPEEIKKKHQNPSTNKEYPTGIDRNDVSMTFTGSRSDVRNQGSTDLEFGAYPDDVVSFSSTTTPDNSAYAVSIYSIQDNSRNRIFSMPVTKENSIELKVQGRGTTNFMLLFGIYTKDGNGKPKDLIGCFYFDPSITIR